MEPPREGSSVTRPPFLDGSNYSYWKIRMQSFISSIDGHAWSSVILGYKEPVVVDDQGNSTPKEVAQWTAEEHQKSMNNSKALNAIYNGIDVGQFRMISSYKTAKEVWDALETTHEGTSKVKQTKLIMLKSRFDSLLMQPDSSIAEFYKELRDIANESYSLGKTYSEFDMVMKVLTSLPEKFAPKKTAMMESNDVMKMKLEELIGSLQTYEMEMKMQDQNKGLAERARSLAFVSAESKIDDENENEEILTKKIGRYMKQLNLLKKEKQSSSAGNRFNKNEGHGRDKKLVRCFECQGFGHLKAECANVHKQKKKSLKTTLSDSETESDEEDVSYNNVISFTAQVEESVKTVSVKTETAKTEPVKTDSAKTEEDDEYSDDEDMPTYEELLQNFVNTSRQNVSLIKEKKELKFQIGDLKTQLQKKEEELLGAKHDLEEINKRVMKMNNGITKPEQILTTCKAGHQTHGKGKGTNSCSKNVYVSGSIQNSKNTSHQQVGAQKFRPICHFCGRHGHIRPHCYNYIQSMGYFTPYYYKKVWVRKDRALKGG